MKIEEYGGSDEKYLWNDDEKKVYNTLYGEVYKYSRIPDFFLKCLDFLEASILIRLHWLYIMNQNYPISCSHKKLANQFSASIKTIQRKLINLENRGLISIDRTTGETNIISVNMSAFANFIDKFGDPETLENIFLTKNHKNKNSNALKNANISKNTEKTDKKHLFLNDDTEKLIFEPHNNGQNVPSGDIKNQNEGGRDKMSLPQGQNVSTPGTKCPYPRDKMSLPPGTKCPSIYNIYNNNYNIKDKDSITPIFQIGEYDSTPLNYKIRISKKLKRNVIYGNLRTFGNKLSKSSISHNLQTNYKTKESITGIYRESIYNPISENSDHKKTKIGFRTESISSYPPIYNKKDSIPEKNINKAALPKSPKKTKKSQHKKFEEVIPEEKLLKDIEVIYKLYPRHDGKKKGVEKLTKYLKKEFDSGGIGAYKNLLVKIYKHIQKIIIPKFLNDGDRKYIKHFSTFINSEAWNDAEDERVVKDNPTTLSVKKASDDDDLKEVKKGSVSYLSGTNNMVVDYINKTIKSIVTRYPQKRGVHAGIHKLRRFCIEPFDRKDIPLERQNFIASVNANMLLNSFEMYLSDLEEDDDVDIRYEPSLSKWFDNLIWLDYSGYFSEEEYRRTAEDGLQKFLDNAMERIKERRKNGK